jgi:hypothetical protein
MAEIVKMCDMSKDIASMVFKLLNGSKVHLKDTNSCVGTIIVTDVEPKHLVYPEGWYYAKGYFRNKHTSTTGFYEEVLMTKSNGKNWSETAHYCTLD